MRTVDDYANSRTAHRDGMAIRQIARTFHVSRRTVREALASPEPRLYTRTKPPPAPVLGPFTAIIDQVLRDDRDAPPTQRHTAAQLFRRLQDEHGYTGSYPTVRRVRRRPRRSGSTRAVPAVGDRDHVVSLGVQDGRAGLDGLGRAPAFPCRAEQDQRCRTRLDVHRHGTATAGADNDNRPVTIVFGLGGADSLVPVVIGEGRVDASWPCWVIKVGFTPPRSITGRLLLLSTIANSVDCNNHASYGLHCGRGDETSVVERHAWRR